MRNQNAAHGLVVEIMYVGAADHGQPELHGILVRERVHVGRIRGIIDLDAVAHVRRKLDV